MDDLGGIEKHWLSKDRVRKAKIHLNLPRQLKEYKCFYRYISSKRKARNNVGLLNGAGELVAKDMEKAKMLNTFLDSIFTDFGFEVRRFFH
ncbi:hypothetical protein BTVI_41202 [Pitangus sulphuratus]|nr:hypothetical protein BTVI_41202 [Pitangus sulphuratus]